MASFLSDNGHDVVMYDQFTKPAAVDSGLVIHLVGFEILKKLG